MGPVAIGGCAGLYGWLQVVDYSNIKESPANDWVNPHYGGFIVIYLLFGLTYSGYQMVVEWVTASLSNDPSVLSQYAGSMRGMASLECASRSPWRRRKCRHMGS
jgi:hypothetical protein